MLLGLPKSLHAVTRKTEAAAVSALLKCATVPPARVVALTYMLQANMLVC